MTSPDLAALSEAAAKELIDLDTLPEQIQSLRNHAAERRGKGWLKSADNLDASAYLIETLAAECALHRAGRLVHIDEGMRERVADALLEYTELSVLQVDAVLPVFIAAVMGGAK